jgi:ferrochelatase
MIGKLGVVLFNLGGPDSLAAVRPFLFNLFKDPAIIKLPAGLRHFVAGMIAWRRAPVAREIYHQIGGSSPILPGTERQAVALQVRLAPLAREVKVAIAMRYWHPFSDEAAADMAEWGPERLVLLPLYPQFSTTTSGSSLKDWERAARKAGLEAPTTALCCYPRLPGWVMAQADLLRAVLAELGEGVRLRLLFSAHGLPKKIVEAGDPYQHQVEMGAAAIVAALGWPDLDWRISYQSRVGPLEWIGPATEEEIRRAGAEGKGLVVLPIAFVSEHSETLVELDIEYAHLAERSGVPFYRRVATVDDHPLFIGGLADMVAQSLAVPEALLSAEGERICPAQCSGCIQGGKHDGLV